MLVGTEMSEFPVWGREECSAQGGNPGHRWSAGAVVCVWVI